MTVDSKTQGLILGYRAAKTVKSYAAANNSSLSLKFLPDDLRGQPTSSACH